MNLQETKLQNIKKICNKDGIISALAIDQRGALKKMMNQHQTTETTKDQIEDFKVLVSEKLTPFASAILLDPEYGLPAATKKDSDSGLLLAYEKTGYDATVPGRLPDLLTDWSVQRLKNEGANACKFLLYYDIDESPEINHQKHVFIERIGSECVGEGLPFFLELVSYDATGLDANSPEYALKKPLKVIEMMKEFSKEQYNVDVLKVEVPVNMNYVEGYSNNKSVYTKQEAETYFKEQTDSTKLPFIFLSAGVSASLFQETLKFAKKAGSTFNGVLCGRATWAGGVEPFITSGDKAAIDWLTSTGKQNIEELDKVLKETATPLTI